jgi:regulatory protein
MKTNNLYERAVEYVLTVQRTEKQMLLWLQRKNCENPDEMIERLKEHNLINDEEYARNYAQCKAVKMGKGMIRNKLLVNGISPGIIETSLRDIDGQTDLLASTTEKYMRSKEKIPENKSKLFRYLLGKGFQFEEIQEVVDECWDRH